MCRLFLSINNENIQSKIFDFLKQSNHKRKFTPGLDNHRDYDTNEDGFGFAWIETTKPQTWNIYKQPLMYLNDANLKHMFHNTNFFNHNIYIGHIREKNKSIVGEIHENNTHPFIYQNKIFVHNGTIKYFKHNAEKIRSFISPDLRNEIKGDTDSETIFFLFLTFLQKYSIETSLNKLFQLFKKNNIEISANFIYGEPDYFVIVRYIYYNKKNYTRLQYPPSLYYFTENPIENLLITSEPITPEYKLFHENTALIIKNQTPYTNFQKMNYKIIPLK